MEGRAGAGLAVLSASPCQRALATRDRSRINRQSDCSAPASTHDLNTRPPTPRAPQVYGGKVAELDGTPTEPRNYDEVASRNQFNWVAR